MLKENMAPKSGGNFGGAEIVLYSPSHKVLSAVVKRVSLYEMEARLTPHAPDRPVGRLHRRPNTLSVGVAAKAPFSRRAAAEANR